MPKRSSPSRGAFDLLATRGATQLGVQVKRSPLPLRFAAPEWKRMAADANPEKVRRGKELRLGGAAAIESLVEWPER